MTDLATLLRDQMTRFDEIRVGDSGTLQVDISLSCNLEVTVAEPEPGTDGPTIKAVAQIAPGGFVTEATLEARSGDATRTLDIAPETGLHQALQGWFHDMWDTWDEVPVAAGVQPLAIHASELEPEDHLWRYGLTVARVCGGGINSTGQPVVTVSFEETTGTEVWPATKAVTIVRSRDRDDRQD